MKYYDVTFHSVNSQVVKRNIPSEKENFDAWQDACASFTETTLNILINDGTQVILNRQQVVRIDIEEVVDPIDKDMKRRDEIINVVNTLSNMGF